MNGEVALRKEAVQRFLAGETQLHIAQALGRSDRWVRYWLARYDADDPAGSLQDRSRAPRQANGQWPEAVRQQALVSRRRRQAADTPGYEHALVSATAIHYELVHLSDRPAPSARTIHRWLRQAGLVTPARPEPRQQTHTNNTYPQPPWILANDLHQLDMKGPFYLYDSSQKHYLLVARDVASRGVVLAAVQDKRAPAIAAFLVAAWQTRGLPMVLQTDNGLEFRGSNRYPRSFGLVVRLALDVGVEPLFIPPHEPWRNGGVERFNGLTQRLLLDRCHFATSSDLQLGVAALQTAVNTTHRLAALDGLTPDEFIAGSRRRFLSLDYDGLQRDLPLRKGALSFIRLVRPDGRITLCAHDQFAISPDLAWQYVLARIDVAAQRLDVYHRAQLIMSFDFPLSPSRTGKMS